MNRTGYNICKFAFPAKKDNLKNLLILHSRQKAYSFPAIEHNLKKKVLIPERTCKNEEAVEESQFTHNVIGLAVYAFSLGTTRELESENVSF